MMILNVVAAVAESRDVGPRILTLVVFTGSVFLAEWCFRPVPVDEMEWLHLNPPE